MGLRVDVRTAGTGRGGGRGPVHRVQQRPEGRGPGDMDQLSAAVFAVGTDSDGDHAGWDELVLLAEPAGRRAVRLRARRCRSPAAGGEHGRELVTIVIPADEEAVAGAFAIIRVPLGENPHARTRGQPQTEQEVGLRTADGGAPIGVIGRRLPFQILPQCGLIAGQHGLGVQRPPGRRRHVRAVVGAQQGRGQSQVRDEPVRGRRGRNDRDLGLGGRERVRAAKFGGGVDPGRAGRGHALGGCRDAENPDIETEVLDPTRPVGVGVGVGVGDNCFEVETADIPLVDNLLVDNLLRDIPVLAGRLSVGGLGDGPPGAIDMRLGPAWVDGGALGEPAGAAQATTRTTPGSSALGAGQWRPNRPARSGKFAVPPLRSQRAFR